MTKRSATKKVRTLATSQDGERLHIRIPPDLKEAARETAAEDGRSMSNFVLQVLREELKRRDKLN